MGDPCRRERALWTPKAARRAFGSARRCAGACRWCWKAARHHCCHGGCRCLGFAPSCIASGEGWRARTRARRSPSTNKQGPWLCSRELRRCAHDARHAVANLALGSDRTSIMNLHLPIFQVLLELSVCLLPGLQSETETLKVLFFLLVEL